MFAVEPEVSVQTRRIGQQIGRETILSCDISAFPQLVTLWKRKGKQLFTGDRYTVEANTDIDNRLVTLSLRINHVRKEDFGKYVCQGINYLGDDDASVTLYGKRKEGILFTVI